MKQLDALRLWLIKLKQLFKISAKRNTHRQDLYCNAITASALVSDKQRLFTQRQFSFLEQSLQSSLDEQNLFFIFLHSEQPNQQSGPL